MWQDVVILGTGAFALEAMEAAHRARAHSITLVTRPRDRSGAPHVSGMLLDSLLDAISQT